MVHRNVELHGGAEHTLQQGIVQFLGYAHAFGKALFEADVQLSGGLVKAQTMESKYREYPCDDARERKPPLLPECRFAMGNGKGYYPGGGQHFGSERRLKI